MQDERARIRASPPPLNIPLPVYCGRHVTQRAAGEVGRRDPERRHARDGTAPISWVPVSTTSRI